MNKKRLPQEMFPQRDDFSMLCQVLCENKTDMIKIAEDIGELYRKKTFYDGYDFDWLFETKAKRYMRTLTKEAEKSANIAEYL